MSESHLQPTLEFCILTTNSRNVGRGFKLQSFLIYSVGERFGDFMFGNLERAQKASAFVANDNQQKVDKNNLTAKRTSLAI